MKIKYTKHALAMLAFRGIKKNQVLITIKSPDDELRGKGGKSVLYKNFGKIYLQVVIVKEKAEVVVITNHWIAKNALKSKIS